MVFSPLWSLVLVNKPETWLKCLDKQGRGGGRSRHWCWGSREHMDWVSRLPHVHGVVTYPAPCRPSNKETNSATPCSKERCIWPSPA